MRVRTTKTLFFLILCLLFSGVFVAGAQPDSPIPIAVGETAVGEISTDVSSVTYVVPIASPQTITIEVFAITSGLAPSIRVIDQIGTIVQTAINTGDQTIVEVPSLPVDPGFYSIVVLSQSGSAGQFLLNLQEGVPLQPPQVLGPGQVFDGMVSAERPQLRYLFSGRESLPMLLTIYSEEASAGLSATLFDADSGETLAMNDSRISGARYRIVPAQANYLVEVTGASTSVSQDFVICLEFETGASICPAGPADTAMPTVTVAPPVATIEPAATPTATPRLLATLPATGPCIVASGGGGPVNIRSGPSTSYSVVGQINGDTTVPVIGRLPDNSWYQINLNGILGWISATVIRVGGQCGSVAPVTITPTPTVTSTPTPVDTTLTMTMTSSPTPTWTVTPTATMTPAGSAAVPTLNFSLPPNYGSTALTSGFVPDPFTVNVTSGGPVNVAYLGGGCVGYATSSPNFSVNYTAGAFPLLRFYFIGNGDTTMVINTPGGSYTCVDDSFGTLNPTVDFSTPLSGRYDVWVGSYLVGMSSSGTLYVTENSASHP